MFPPNLSGDQTSESDLENDTLISSDIVVANGGDKNGVWFRYVVVSIAVFISHNRPDDDGDEVVKKEGSPYQHQEICHVIDVVNDNIRDGDDVATEEGSPPEKKSESKCHVINDGDVIERIVKDRDLKALRRLGGVDWAVSLQRSHFEVYKRCGCSNSF